jgi:hypothetical protein
MKPKKLLFTGFMLLFLVSCGSTSNSFIQKEVLRNATDTPAYFESPVSFPGERVCKSPMTDPRNGTKINFIRSSWPMADYEVPTGKYGVKSNELLRVNCETGEVVGIVRQ